MTPLPESTAGPKTTIVITSISAPNQALRDYALGCARHGAKLLVMGDQESPSDFSLDECDYYDVRRQLETGFRAAAVAPLGHYARKNIGYLLAMGAGAPYIVETDDDNIPLPGFWSSRRKRHTVRCSVNRGWVNVYRYFSSGAIWPRGFPLSELRTPVIPFDELPLREIECPIQQALADGDPDVDSIHRLVFPGRTHFAANRSVAIAPGSWCPFNSQNTTWWPECYPLMYLPGCCSMRLTDIRRSFVAQRIVSANGWGIRFESPTVEQHRNAHDLMRDFEDEVPGYLSNASIVAALERVDIRPGAGRIVENLWSCYEELARSGLIAADEMRLLDAWLADYAAVASSYHNFKGGTQT